MACNIPEEQSLPRQKSEILHGKKQFYLIFFFNIRHIFLILIDILFYCDVISFKETSKYGKTAEIWLVSCAKDKQS
jgi:hypothetical protein